MSANAAFASSQARPDQQGRALGGLFGATGAGSLTGPLLGSVLASLFGFPVRAVPRLLAATSAGRNLILAGFLGQAAVYAVLVVFAPRVEEVTATAKEATVWVGILQAVTWAAALVGAGWWGWRNDRGPAHRNFALAALGCAAAVALQGAAIEPELLLPLRIAQGFCFAALAQSVLYVVAALAPEAGKGSSWDWPTESSSRDRSLGRCSAR